MADTSIRTFTFHYPENSREITFTKRDMRDYTLESLRGFFLFSGSVYLAVLTLLAVSLSRKVPFSILMQEEYIRDWGPSVLQITAVFLVIVALVFYSSSKATSGPSYMKGVLYYGFTDEFLYVRSPLSDARVSWRLFTFARETKTAFYLHDGARYFLLPKRPWSEAEVDRIRGLVAAAVPARRARLMKPRKAATET
ncbi:YcxB family protein [Phaeovibrio sulfidiphilus]|uniref:YcxB family protein n=1 Tax=Phaeovibrio sulfidiphilus TaxID=1220600 RepID=A0A8J6YWE2_9PROT|nr:YcxB family protein [Phaeovibrio sulfidiphilus]MBE1237679.1 YcxB family protein [Phaeovibrio sulfidiphilus]